MAAFLLLLLAVATAAAQDWPQLLGPTRDGVYTGPISEKSVFKQLWSVEIGEGFSGVAVARGRAIVFHRQGGNEIVESLDAATGKSQWKLAYPTSYRDDFGFSEGPRATPAIDGDLVFTYGAEGMLHAVNLLTGAKVWSVDARRAFGIRKEFFGTACSPLVDGDRLLMNIGGAKDAGLVAVDKKTGRVLWNALTHESGYASPTVATIGGERHAIFFTREGFVDADPATGRIRSQHRWRARQAASVNAASPLVAGDEVFLTSSYNTGAIVLKIAGDKLTTVWSGDDSLSSHYATPVRKDGYLYGFHGRQEYGQSLRCIEWRTGKVMWNVDGFKAGTVTLAGPYLALLTEEGELQLAPASPKEFKVVRKTRVADRVVRAFPAWAAGRLYVRTGNSIAAFQVN